MKTLAKQLASVALIFGGLVATASVLAPKAYSQEEYLEDNHAIPGMFFSTEYVVEEYEYDEAYCLVYDDADANMFNVEIPVDMETYQLVIEAIETGNELTGSLVLNDDYSYDGVEVFTYIDEEP